MPRTAWNKRLTPETEHLIMTRYQAGLSAGEVLKLIPFKTRKTGYDVLEKHGIPRRNGIRDYKSYNEAVFASVDTPAKAHRLGILLTDGYIIDTGKTGEPQVGLQMADRELLEKFREFLGSDRDVFCISPRSHRHRPLYRVIVSSRRMANDLRRYGVVPRKTLSTYLPVLPPALMPHLLRGILDGDGTISHRADGGAIIGYAGSERLVIELRMWLGCKLGISDNRIHKNGAACFVQWSHRQDVQRIVRYLYQDADLYLERKYALIKEFL